MRKLLRIIQHISRCTQMLKLIESYTLNMCSSLHVNYTSIKLFNKSSLITSVLEGWTNFLLFRRSFPYVWVFAAELLINIHHDSIMFAKKQNPPFQRSKLQLRNILGLGRAIG